MAILLASLVSTAILTAIIVFTSSRYTGYRVIHQIQDVLPASIGVLIMGVVVYFCGKIQLSCFVVLGIQIIVGAAVYVLYSVITKNKEFVFLMNYLKGFFMRRKK